VRASRFEFEHQFCLKSRRDCLSTAASGVVLKSATPREDANADVSRCRHGLVADSSITDISRCDLARWHNACNATERSEDKQRTARPMFLFNALVLT
jgi:hypothetical protein